jgi:hypothetical protein
VGGAVEAVLQEVADHAERGQPHPAGLDGARAGHAVAFALLAHLGLHVLQKKEKLKLNKKASAFSNACLTVFFIVHYTG